MARTLSPEQARAFYDRMGAMQDSQSWYEEPALDALVEEGDFGVASAVLEIGCGTGRFAERLLEHELPADARYVGIDLSATMVGLAKKRLARFGDRVEVRQVAGEPRLDLADARVDRVVSTYVFDLLSEADIDALLDESLRVLRPDGRLCLASLTQGESTLAACITSLWRGVHALSPQIVGGCRPLQIATRLDPDRWHLRARRLVEPYGLASEALVAERLA